MASSTAGEVITCKAGVVWEAGQPISIQQIQVAPPQSKEVRIKITHTSLCHTDIYFWKGKDGGAWFPRILGHEGAGIVESVGSEVTELKAGDHVIPTYMAECKECELCDRGKNNICEIFRFNFFSGVTYTDKKCRFSLNGKPIHHFVGLSTFSEYTVMHMSCVAKVNPEAPLDKICLLGCGVPTGLGAAWNGGKVKPGDSVAIFGLGTIGLAAAEGARIAGASRILGIDINPEKEETSKRFGVTEFLNPSDFDKPIQEVIREMTKGGVDSSYECVGRVELMLAALQCSHPVWGRTIIMGLNEMDKKLSFNPLELLEGRKLKFVCFGDFKNSDIPKLVDKYMNNEFDLEKFITQRMAFSEINAAMEMLIAGKCLRCVLYMDEKCPN
jgi:Zn-dependent alcohol dehydrogenase